MILDMARQMHIEKILLDRFMSKIGCMWNVISSLLSSLLSFLCYLLLSAWNFWRGQWLIKFAEHSSPILLTGRDDIPPKGDSSVRYIYIHIQKKYIYIYIYIERDIYGSEGLPLRDMLSLVCGGWGLDALGKFFRRRRLLLFRQFNEKHKQI